MQNLYLSIMVLLHCWLVLRAGGCCGLVLVVVHVVAAGRRAPVVAQRRVVQATLLHIKYNGVKTSTTQKYVYNTLSIIKHSKVNF